MYVSGHFKMDGTEPRVVAVVRPVSPPSILEIRMEGNMFVTHYQLDMRCTFFDGRYRIDVVNVRDLRLFNFPNSS